MNKKIFLTIISFLLLITGCQKKKVQQSISSNDSSLVSVNTTATSLDVVNTTSLKTSSNNITSNIVTTTSIKNTSITNTTINNENTSSSILENTTSNDLFISEVFNISYKKNVYEVQNSNNDKALELYNPLDTSIDLSKYKIEIYSSGESTIKSNDYIINLSGTLESKKTYTLVNEYARDILKAKADLITKVFIGAKSSIALYKDNTLLDVFGTIGKKYESNSDFSINGISGALDVHNVIRLEGFHANTNFTENEWEVRFDSDLSSLGKYGNNVSSNNNDFDQELGELALELLIETYYNGNDSIVNGDVTLYKEFEGFNFSYRIPYNQDLYNDEGKMIKKPSSDIFYITIEISLLDNNGNIVKTSYGYFIYMDV